MANHGVKPPFLKNVGVAKLHSIPRKTKAAPLVRGAATNFPVSRMYTQIKEDLNLPIGKAGISLIDLYDFQRIASTVRSKPPCQTLYSGACPAK
ncbi:MAG: hypothetical protein KF734_07840 [Saprospiraceae bacterium]|nr:hypothetical protein [Saprospiraceae bacterium]